MQFPWKPNKMKFQEEVSFFCCCCWRLKLVQICSAIANTGWKGFIRITYGHIQNRSKLQRVEVQKLLIWVAFKKSRNLPAAGGFMWVQPCWKDLLRLFLWCSYSRRLALWWVLERMTYSAMIETGPAILVCSVVHAKHCHRKSIVGTKCNTIVLLNRSSLRLLTC